MPMGSAPTKPAGHRDARVAGHRRRLDDDGPVKASPWPRVVSHAGPLVGATIASRSCAARAPSMSARARWSPAGGPRRRPGRSPGGAFWASLEQLLAEVPELHRVGPVERDQLGERRAGAGPGVTARYFAMSRLNSEMSAVNSSSKTTDVVDLVTSTTVAPAARMACTDALARSHRPRASAPARRHTPIRAPRSASPVEPVHLRLVGGDRAGRGIARVRALDHVHRDRRVDDVAGHRAGGVLLGGDRARRPARLTSPSVGLRPTTPFAPDGQTIEPSVSVPIATWASAAATAAPEPLDDPHGLRSST